jgi:hypothetical protein
MVGQFHPTPKGAVIRMRRWYVEIEGTLPDLVPVESKKRWSVEDVKEEAVTTVLNQILLRGISHIEQTEDEPKLAHCVNCALPQVALVTATKDGHSFLECPKCKFSVHTLTAADANPPKEKQDAGRTRTR